jgi:flagellar hook-associated protein 2
MTASAVQASPGTYKLQVASKASGVAGSLSLDLAAFSTTLGNLETLSAGLDAKLTVGSGTTAFSVTSGSNTFGDVMPGVTLTALKADTSQPITVSVANDSGALADKVGKLVEAVNGALSYIKVQSVYNTETRQGGPLLGDPTARQLESALYRTVGNLKSGTSLSTAGLSVTKEGYLSLDKAAFVAAYEKDPVAMAAYFHDAGTVGTTDDGLAKRLEAMAKAATDSVGGMITNAIAGRKKAVSMFQRAIEDWDVRLERRERTLRRQFTAMEGSLGTMRNQSNWLAGQISGLPGFSRSGG